jgi:hypothetical protein
VSVLTPWNLRLGSEITYSHIPTAEADFKRYTRFVGAVATAGSANVVPNRSVQQREEYIMADTPDCMPDAGPDDTGPVEDTSPDTIEDLPVLYPDNYHINNWSDNG